MNTRDATDQELAVWNRFVQTYEKQTMPLSNALRLLVDIASGAEYAARQITGKQITIIPDDSKSVIADLIHKTEIINRQINGVLVNKYGIMINNGDLDIVAGDAPEGDVIQSFSGLGGIVVVMGIAAVVLLGGGLIALGIIDKLGKQEALRISERMQAVDAEIMSGSPEKRAQWTKWKKENAEVAIKAAKNIPWASDWIKKFFGSKTFSIGMVGLVGIAAAYILLPHLRRN